MPSLSSAISAICPHYGTRSVASEIEIRAFTLSYHSSSSGPCIIAGPWYAFGQWPAADAVEDFTPECETGVEAPGGVLLRQTSGVTAEHERCTGQTGLRVWPVERWRNLLDQALGRCESAAAVRLAIASTHWERVRRTSVEVVERNPPPDRTAPCRSPGNVLRKCLKSHKKFGEFSSIRSAIKATTC